MCGVSTTFGTVSSAGWTEGSPSNTSRPAAAIWPAFRACARAASSTIPPRAMLISVAVGCICASSAAPMVWWFSAVYGSTSTTWSAVRSSSSLLTYRALHSASSAGDRRERL